MPRLLHTVYAAGFVLAALILRGQETSVPSQAPLPPDLQAELDALQQSAWHHSATARASVGWRDNVLLSPFVPIARSFGRGEIEAILMRPQRNRWEFVSFLNGDVLRYFSPPAESAGEQQWSLHAEGRWQPIDRARLALKATGYLHDMVIDLSETEARRVVAPTRVRGGFATATTRLDLPGRLRIEPLVQVRRTDYRDYAGDYDEVRSGARIEWQPRERWSVIAGWFDVQREYAERVQFTAGGRALLGTRLEFHQRDAELKLRKGWTAGGEWSVAVSAGKIENRDEASGYFDYDQDRARLEIGWEHGAWRVLLDAAGKRMEYRVQTVGAGLVPPTRRADDYETMLRVERDFDRRWTWFAEHRWERSRSNEVEFSYRANTVLAGVQRSF